MDHTDPEEQMWKEIEALDAVPTERSVHRPSKYEAGIGWRSVRTPDRFRHPGTRAQLERGIDEAVLLLGLQAREHAVKAGALNESYSEVAAQLSRKARELNLVVDFLQHAFAKWPRMTAAEAAAWEKRHEGKF